MKMENWMIWGYPYDLGNHRIGNQQAKNIIANEGYAGLFGPSAIFGRLGTAGETSHFCRCPKKGTPLNFIRFHRSFHYKPSIFGVPPYMDRF